MLCVIQLGLICLLNTLLRYLQVGRHHLNKNKTKKRGRVKLREGGEGKGGGGGVSEVEGMLACGGGEDGAHNLERILGPLNIDGKWWDGMG